MTANAYEVIDDAIDAMIATDASPAHAPSYMPFIDVEKFWRGLSGDQQAKIGVAAIMHAYATFLRGDTASPNDRLYEEMETELVIEEAIEETGIFKLPPGLPLGLDGDLADAGLYDEYFRSVLPTKDGPPLGFIAPRERRKGWSGVSFEELTVSRKLHPR